MRTGIKMELGNERSTSHVVLDELESILGSLYLALEPRF
jgi:hypothetical protein